MRADRQRLNVGGGHGKLDVQAGQSIFLLVAGELVVAHAQRAETVKVRLALKQGAQERMAVVREVAVVVKFVPVGKRGN